MDEQDNAAWFTAGGRANREILELLVELRTWHIKNGLTGGLAIWNDCEVTLDLIKKNLNIKIIYKNIAC